MDLSDFVDTVANLPFETLFVLGSGYLAYRLGHMGRDQHHQTFDVLFLVCVYGAVANLGWVLTTDTLATSSMSAVAVQSIASLIGLFLALATAALWRRKLAQLVQWLLVKTSISYAQPGERIIPVTIGNPRFAATTIQVTLKDGTDLYCALGEMPDRTMPEAVIADDGGVAMYITHRKDPGDERVFELEFHDIDELGHQYVIVPPSEIAMISARIK